MISKKVRGNRCWVSFYLTTEGNEAYLVGEWNNWEPKKMKRRKDGTFWCTQQFKPGKTYRFRYLIDSNQWLNDPEADDYYPNPYGSEDSILKT